MNLECIAPKENPKYIFFLLFALITFSASAQWQPFIWAEFQQDKAMNRRAGILLPVKLDGIDCNMQLDTGVGLSTLYRNALPARYSALSGADTLLVVNFSLGSETSAKQFQLMYKKKLNSPRKCNSLRYHSIVGTLGNDYFLNGTIRLDMASGRYQFIKGPLQSTDGEKSQSLDIEIFRTEKFGAFPVVTVTFENRDQRKMIFDTGSASFDFRIYLKNDWLSLVGLQKIEAVEPIMIPRFGRLIPCYSAPIVQAVSLGGIRLERDTKAMYCDDPRDRPQEGNQVFGVLGLAPFSQKIVSVDYVAQKIFVEATSGFAPISGRNVEP